MGQSGSPQSGSRDTINNYMSLHNVCYIQHEGIDHNCRRVQPMLRPATIVSNSIRSSFIILS